MSLSKESLLQCHPKLVIEPLNRGVWQLRIEQFTVEGREEAVRLVNIFKTEMSFYQGLETFSETFGANQDWPAVTQTVIELVDNGVLLTKPVTPIVASHTGRFDSAPVHIRMLNDEARTSAYQHAIREQVTENDIVLDIGTGTGILAATAAMAGAKHVYAIEQTPLADIAQQVFEQNGLADKITVIKGNSRTISLPEKATVLVSELIGNDPLAEGLLSTTEDAISRLMAPNCRLIPASLSTYALPFNIPESELAKHKFLAPTIQSWQELYGIDFSPFMRMTDKNEQLCAINTYDTKTWTRLSKPVLLNDFDLACLPYANAEFEGQFDVIGQGELNGILVFFEMMLCPDRLFSIHPDKVTASNHWKSHVWLAGQPLNVENGQKVRFHYNFENGRSTFNL
jgi:predicted RNA methylase